MSDIKIWEEKIKEKRKTTPFRDFVREICSWSPLNLYNTKYGICRYPETGRIKNIDKKEAQNNNNRFIDYNSSKTFFENFKDLSEKVYYQNLMDFGSNENSYFVDQAFGVKNGYLSFVSGFGVENIMYSAYCYENLTNIFNCFMITHNSNNIYFSSNIEKSYNIFYSRYIIDSSDIWFSSNLIGCQECIFCDGLENKKYCFKNKNYKKEEYLEIKKQILEKKEKFLENYKFISKNKPRNYISENVNGSFIRRSRNIENGYFVTNTSNSRNIINVGGDDIKNFYDSFDAGVNSENFYGAIGAGNNCKNLFCSTQIESCSNIYYSYFLSNCSFCLGCIGLKNKSFCILNKQYSKDERFKKVNEIFEAMENDGFFGEFFPGELNPFYFNDTAAYLIDDSFSKEEVEKLGFLWREEDIKVDIEKGIDLVYTASPAHSSSHPHLSGSEKESLISNYQGYDEEGNWYINPEIMKKIIVDNNGNYYKITKMEYDFLKKYSLPIPEIHRIDRIKLNFNFKNII